LRVERLLKLLSDMMAFFYERCRAVRMAGGL
jgi:hypothetical protein